MKTSKAEGIVLNTVKYGESAVVAHVLTDTLGRRSFLVQGIRSGRGRGNRAALLQPMFPLAFEAVESPRTELLRMKDVRPAFPLRSLPFDVRKSTMALFMAEVIYRLVRESERNPELYGFVRGSVEALDGLADGVANFHLWFLVRLSRFLGFYPADEYAPGAVFDIAEGRFALSEPSHRLTLGRAESALLGRLMDTDIGELAALKLSRAARSSFLEAMLFYFGYHLDAVDKIRSVRILSEVF